MAVRYLTEDDVTATLDVATTIDLLAAAARALAAGEAMNFPRQRPRIGATTMHVLPAAYGGRLGHKTYVVAPKPRGARFIVTLYAQSGEMLALIEANALGQIRTGAASGLATRAMARANATRVAILGSGRQAGAQLEAVCAVRAIERVWVWSRDGEHAQRFAETMRSKIAAPIAVAADVASAVRDAGVICTMTSANEPFLPGAAIAPGTHVNAAGSNRATSAEIDAEVVRRAAVVAVEDVGQAKIESGDLLGAERAGAFVWSRAVPLSQIVAGNEPGRLSDDDVTLFESLGIGLWDIAAANCVYDRCIAAGRGRDVDVPA